MSIKQITTKLYYPKKTRSVSILLKNQRKKHVNIDTQEELGIKSQVNLSQPKEIPRQIIQKKFLNSELDYVTRHPK